MITIPLPQAYHTAAPVLDTPPPPPPVFAVPALPSPTPYVSPFPPHQAHQVPLTVYHHPHPHPYVTALPEIEFEVPAHQFPHVLQEPFAHTADAPHHPEVAVANAHPALPVPCDAVDVPAVPAGHAHHPLPQFTQFIAPLHIPAPPPHPQRAVFVANVAFPPLHPCEFDAPVPPAPTVTVYACGVTVTAVS